MTTYANAGAKLADEHGLAACFMLIKDKTPSDALQIMTELAEKTAKGSRRGQWPQLLNVNETGIAGNSKRCRGYLDIWRAINDSLENEQASDKTGRALSLLKTLLSGGMHQSDEKEREYVQIEFGMHCFHLIERDNGRLPEQWQRFLKLFHAKGDLAKKILEKSTLFLNRSTIFWLYANTGADFQHPCGTGIPENALRCLWRVITLGEGIGLEAYTMWARLLRGPAMFQELRLMTHLEINLPTDRDVMAACISAAEAAVGFAERINAFASKMVELEKGWKLFKLKNLEHGLADGSITKVLLEAYTGHGDIYHLPLSERDRLITEGAEIIRKQMEEALVACGIGGTPLLMVEAMYSPDDEQPKQELLNGSMEVKMNSGRRAWTKSA